MAGKVGNGVGAEDGGLRSVQYTIQATEYHDSRVKKLDDPLLTRAATPGPPVPLPCFYIFPRSLIAIFLFSRRQ